MPYHFYNCHTIDEIKARYKALSRAMTTDSQIADLQDQYDRIHRNIQNQPKLPPLYHITGHYLYLGAKVVYFQRDNHYYKFHKEGGADVWIDAQHTYLIKS